MSGFLRRFLEDPGDDVLLEIESINIIDREPPAVPVGVGTGTALLVGEFEEGDFDTPEEHLSDTDFKRSRGGFGFARSGTGLQYQDVCGREHDGEAFNGNGFLALVGKKFKRLITVRVDTSVGSVAFSRLAFLLGNTQLRWDLEPAQTLAFNVDGAPAPVVTFDAAAGTVSGIGGVFPTLFAGGETLTLKANALDDAVQVTFLAADQTAAQCRDRINAYMGFAFCDLNAGQLRFTSDIRGTDGDVTVVSGSVGVLAQLGLVAATTPGTGDVANIDDVTLAEVDALVNADTAGAVRVDRDGDGSVRFRNEATLDGTGTLEYLVASTATDFGLTSGVISDAADADNTGGSIPAGTRVTDGVTDWVTMQTITVPDGADGAGPFSVKIRPAEDDDTALGAAVAAVDTVTDQPTFAPFAVTNALPVTVALTSGQLDAQYIAAIDSTVDLNNVSRETNFIWSARQSNNVNRRLKENALTASAVGCLGRKAVIRPPLGTSSAVARGTAQPGVGALRDQRVYFTWPQARVFVPQIARAGATNGGAGFSDDGFIDLGADGFLVSVMCQLRPEQNPGELTSLLTSIAGLESGAPTDMGITDYTALKRAGVVALRMAEGIPIFQSGVTSVDPTTQANLKNISRRNMADYIQDSLARQMLPYQKKLNTKARRNAIINVIDGFLFGLLSPNDESKQRIEGYTIKNASTAEMLAAGLYRLRVRVRNLSTLDSIVLDTEIGENVDITEAAA